MQTFAKQKTRSGLIRQTRTGGVTNQQVRNILRAEVQPKLKIGSVNDPAEAEADRVADQVMRMPSPEAQGPNIFSKTDGNQVRRKCTGCNDDDKIQRKEASSNNANAATNSKMGQTANAVSSEVIRKLGPGSPLPVSEKAFFEPRFGTDLSNVRIHANATANKASNAINARAFSLGNNIAFATGEYNPGTVEGRTLMAHEITHTLQTDSIIRRSVQKCCRNVESGIGPLDFISSALGLKHCWLKTDTEAAGMGPEGDGPLPANPIGIPTMITDHTNDSGDCEAVTNTDESCVNDRLTVGERTGRWGPLNNCNTFVHQTLRSCSTLRFEPRYLGQGSYLQEDGSVTLGPGPKF